MFDWLQHDFMLQALLACSALGLLLAYLGIHVVGRGIVFVDLGLGQISSMGVAYAEFSGRNPVAFSMLFTLAGAAVFSRLQVRDPRLRLEAVIGIFYAASSAVTVLLIAKTPHGDADIQDVLFGSVLALDRGEVLRMLAVFGAVALVHAALGRRFFALTYRKGGGEELTAADHGLNLVFYVLLALAIVFAIRAGGVIPVFSFLIVPPVAALALARRTGAVITLALLFALASSFLGLHLSYGWDLPVGASVVAVLGALALGAGAVKLALGARRARSSGVAALALLTLALTAAPTAAQEVRPESAALAAEIAALRSELTAAQARLGALEAKLARIAESPAPSPPMAPSATPAPTVRAAGGLRLLDLSLDGLFAAAASTASEDELRALEAGGHDPKNRGFTLQNLELTASGVVDPYLRADASLVFQFDEEGESVVEVEEAYLTTLALPGGLQAKAGTFFTAFGRLNAQHPHAWEFADQPVVNGRFLGPDGLRGPGAQLAWLTPLPFFTEVTVGVQSSHGETAFSFRSAPGEQFAGRTIERRAVESPSDLLMLGRVATSFDLTPALTIVPGLSYVRGPNGTGPEAGTSISGLDFYAKWRPLANDHGWPFATLQVELLERRYDAAAQTTADGLELPFELLVDRGAYLQGVWGFRRRWTAGLRLDWTDDGDSSDPLRDARTRWTTNLSFYPSEFSKLRFQYALDRPDYLDEEISTLLFQFEFLYGAHGGHKF